MMRGDAFDQTTPFGPEPASRPKRLSRRSLIQRAAILGLAVPAGGVLLAACGDDEDDPTATAGVAVSPTVDGGAATATTSGDGAPPTAGDADEPTATGAAGETPAPDGDATPTTTPTGTGKSYGSFVPEAAASEGGTVVVGWWDVLYSVNPLYNPGESPLLYPVFETPIVFDPVNDEPLPLLVTTWQVSDDGVSWTFTVREGVNFQDGETLTAGDIVYTYQAHMSEDLASYDRSYVVERIAEISADDEMTVAVTATEVDADFLNVMVYSIVPEHIYGQVPLAEMSEHALTAGTDLDLVVGTGPFRLTERVVDGNWRLTRFDDYWAGPAHLDEVIFEPVLDTTVIATKMLAEENDIVILSFTDIALVQDEEHVTILEALPRGMDYFPFNLDPERAPLFQDVRIRQALAFGLDRQAFIDVVYEGYAEVADGLIPPSLWSANPEGITVLYPYDPEQAMALLEEVGWVMGEDGIREKDGQRLAVEQLNFRTTISELGFQICQENYRQIGVEVTSNFTEPTTTLELYDAGDFEFAYWGVLPFQGSGYDELYAIGHSGSFPNGGNRMGYNNPEYDALLDQAKGEFDPARRIELFTEAQNIFLADLPIIPLVHSRQVYGVNSRLHNVIASSLLVFYNLEPWWVDA
jgi:peptide/nickel transport system substrate-binding protein